MTKIAEKIKSRRINKNLTQQELADLLNVSRSTVSNWETNRNYPDLETLVKISDLLDISLDILLREEEKMVKDITNEVKQSNKRKWILRILIPLFILSLLITTYLVVQNVSSVHNAVFPLEVGTTKQDNDDTSNWNSVYFGEKDHLTFGGLFWKKEITNVANNEEDIILRVRNSERTIIENEIKIPEGKTILLKELKKNQKYYFEIKGSSNNLTVIFS